jgi:hypothetical protein
MGSRGSRGNDSTGGTDVAKSGKREEERGKKQGETVWAGARFAFLSEH